jgi:hypothetical protein
MFGMLSVCPLLNLKEKQPIGISKLYSILKVKQFHLNLLLIPFISAIHSICVSSFTNPSRHDYVALE